MTQSLPAASPTSGSDPGAALRDWGILRDVPLRLTVEVGRTLMTVQDILALEAGGVVVTTKLSGEPMDVSLDREVFARAEVIIIKDKLWARVTKIAGVER